MFGWENEWSERSCFSHVTCTSNESVGLHRKTLVQVRASYSWSKWVSAVTIYLENHCSLESVREMAYLNSLSAMDCRLGQPIYICITCPGYIVYLYRTVQSAHMIQHTHTCTPAWLWLSLRLYPMKAHAHTPHMYYKQTWKYFEKQISSRTVTLPKVAPPPSPIALGARLVWRHLNLVIWIWPVRPAHV